MVRPIVKWAGGKRQLLRELIKRIPEKWGTYYEPFVGGAALLIELYNRKQVRKAIISDMNKELINLYLVIKEHPRELINYLSSPKYKNDKETFLELRNRFNEILDIEEFRLERAALFLYLNKHCYNGLWRVNRAGKFNVPFGKYKNPKLPSEKEIIEFSKMLEYVEILHSDFEDTVKTAKEGDFVYFDPPYQPISSTSYFTDYTVEGFDFSEQVRLARTVEKLDKLGVKVMISNSDDPRIKELYNKYNIYAVNAKRAINSNAKKRTGIKELIITNY